MPSRSARPASRTLQSDLLLEAERQRGRVEEMRAFDQLPSELRRALSRSAARHSALLVLNALRDTSIKTCVCELVEAIALADSRMRSGYRRQVAASSLIKPNRETTT